MGPRRRHALSLLAVGAALVAVPALASSAGSSTATVVGTESRMWSPMEVAITPGGTVTFENPSTTVFHGVVWKTVPETPSCSGVPIDEGKANWKGACTFVKEGVYEYYCYVHGIYMSGKVAVNAAGTTTTTSSSTTSSTTTSTSSSSTSTTSTSTTSTQTSTTTTTEQTQSMTMPGSTSEATSTSSTKSGGGAASEDSLSDGSVRIAARERGDGVRGSVQVAQAGSRLEVELLIPRASIAVAGRRMRTLLVGRLVKSRLPAGRERFEVALKARARRALRRTGRLALSVRIALTPPGGHRLTRTLAVTLRR
jgi:plastocyanin